MDIVFFSHIVFCEGENFYLGQPEEDQPPNMFLACSAVPVFLNAEYLCSI